MADDERDLTEHPLASEWVYRGALLHVKRDRVRLPDGGEDVREYVVHPGAVMVIPLFDDGDVLVERQFRYPLRRTFLEFPAGKIDPGEDPLATGRRELREETGYEAADWRHVTTIHPIIAYSDERIELYLARGLTQATARLDHGEFLEVMKVPAAEAIGWLAAGKVTDVKTVIGLFWLERILAGRA